MHRPTLGVLALLFLCGGIVAWMAVPQSGSEMAWTAGAIRIGALFGALWLAHPQLDRLPRVLWIGILVLAVVVARWRYLLPVAVAVLVAIAILRPRQGQSAKK